MSLSHYFELTPERYMRTYYGFPTFYDCTNCNICRFDSTKPSHGNKKHNINEPCCVNHVQFMQNFSRHNKFLNR
jgi:hypothetical protein